MCVCVCACVNVHLKFVRECVCVCVHAQMCVCVCVEMKTGVCEDTTISFHGIQQLRFLQHLCGHHPHMTSKSTKRMIAPP